VKQFQTKKIKIVTNRLTQLLQKMLRIRKINFLVSLHSFINYHLIIELKKNLVLLEKASKDKDFRITATLSKNLKKLRRMFDLPNTVLVLSFYLPDLFMRL
jgi:hypothetical protein